MGLEEKKGEAEAAGVVEKEERKPADAAEGAERHLDARKVADIIVVEKLSVLKEWLLVCSQAKVVKMNELEFFWFTLI